MGPVKRASASGLWHRLRDRFTLREGPNGSSRDPACPVQVGQADRGRWVGERDEAKPQTTRDSGPELGRRSGCERRRTGTGPSEGGSPQVFAPMTVGDDVARLAYPRRACALLPRRTPAGYFGPARKGRFRCRNNFSARQAELVMSTVRRTGQAGVPLEPLMLRPAPLPPTAPLTISRTPPGRFPGP